MVDLEEARFRGPGIENCGLGSRVSGGLGGGGNVKGTGGPQLSHLQKNMGGLLGRFFALLKCGFSVTGHERVLMQRDGSEETLASGYHQLRLARKF